MMSTDDSPSAFVGHMDLAATEPQYTFSKGQEVRVRADTNPGMKGARAISFVGRVTELQTQRSPPEKGEGHVSASGASRLVPS